MASCMLLGFYHDYNFVELRGRSKGILMSSHSQRQAQRLANEYARRAMAGQSSPTIKMDGSPVNQKFMGHDGIEYGWAKKNGQWTAVPWGSVAGTGNGPIYGPGYQGNSARYVPFG